MTRKAAIEFDKKLQKLFADRTHWLRSKIRKPGSGRTPSFSKEKVAKYIAELQALATKALLRRHTVDGLPHLYDIKKQWHVTTLEGKGVEQKKKAFVAWFGKIGRAHV